MNRRTRSLTVGLTLTLFVILSLLIQMKSRSEITSVQAQSGPTAGIVPANLAQTEATLNIQGANLPALGGFEFDLALNPAVVQAQTAQAGGFLGSSGRSVGSLGPLLGDQAETLAFGAYGYGDAPAPAGDGVLAAVTLSLQGEGLSPLTFTNAIFGDPQAIPFDVTLQDAALQVKHLAAGWSLISPCVDNSAVGVADSMASIAGEYGLILGEYGTYAVGLPDEVQTLTHVTPPGSYWLRANQARTLTLVSSPHDATAPIDLHTGRNWVGYCTGEDLAVRTALNSIDGKYDLIIADAGAFAAGLPDSFQTLQAMHLGDGYLIRMNAAGVLQYPASTGQAARGQIAATAPHAACAAVQHTPDMTLVYGHLTVDGAPAPAGTVVEAVTPRGEVAGCTVVETSGQYGIMQVYGADAEAGIPGFQAGEPIQWRIDGVTVAAAPLTWSGERELQPLDIGRDEPGGPGAGGDIYLPLVVK